MGEGRAPGASLWRALVDQGQQGQRGDVQASLSPALARRARADHQGGALDGGHGEGRAGRPDQVGHPRRAASSRCDDPPAFRAGRGAKGLGVLPLLPFFRLFFHFHKNPSSSVISNRAKITGNGKEDGVHVCYDWERRLSERNFRSRNKWTSSIPSRSPFELDLLRFLLRQS